MGKLIDVSMMDNYYEQIVVKKMSSKKKIMIVLGFILSRSNTNIHLSAARSE